MRKMKRSDVREWIPDEPLERVDFGNGCTGMDKSIPKEPGNAGDFKRLNSKNRIRRSPMRWKTRQPTMPTARRRTEMNTSFDITDIDCAPKELEDALGVSGRTLFDPTEHPIHVDIWDGKAYVTLAEMIELEGDALRHFLAIVFPASPSAGSTANGAKRF